MEDHDDEDRSLAAEKVATEEPEQHVEAASVSSAMGPSSAAPFEVRHSKLRTKTGQPATTCSVPSASTAATSSALSMRMKPKRDGRRRSAKGHPDDFSEALDSSTFLTTPYCWKWSCRAPGALMPKRWIW